MSDPRSSSPGRRDEVTAYVMDPENDPVWISGIEQARMLTEPPLGSGTQVERISSFLGKHIEYVLEVEEHDPDALLESGRAALKRLLESSVHEA